MKTQWSQLLYIFSPLLTPAELAAGLGSREDPTSPMAGFAPINWILRPRRKAGLGDLLKIEYIYGKKVVNININKKMTDDG